MSWVVTVYVPAVLAARMQRYSVWLTVCTFALLLLNVSDLRMGAVLWFAVSTAAAMFVYPGGTRRPAGGLQSPAADGTRRPPASDTASGATVRRRPVGAPDLLLVLPSVRLRLGNAAKRAAISPLSSESLTAAPRRANALMSSRFAT